MTDRPPDVRPRRGAVAALGVIVGGVAISVMGGVAQAVDTRVNGQVSQRLELREVDDNDSPIRATTDIGVTIVRETPRSRFFLAPGLRVALTDEGVDEAEVLPLVNGAGTWRAPRGETTASFGIVPNFVDENDFGVVNDSNNAIEVLFTGRIGQSFRATPRDSFSIGLFGQARTFTESSDSLTESQSVGLDGGWTRRQTPLTNFTLQPRATAFYSDSDTTADSRSISLRGGLETRLSPTTALSGSLGPSLTFRDGEDSELGVVGDLNLSRQGTDTTASFGLSQTVDQNADGETTNRSAARAGLTWRINPRETLSASAALGLETPLFGTEDSDVVLTVSPRYTLALTADWSLAVGYTLRAEEDDDLSLRNSVFLSISRAVSVLP